MPRHYRAERHDHPQFAILIDQIDMDIARGLHPWDAVIDATTHRFRPIVLTAAAAFSA
jgi:multidrug efflux pump subunit AcrB